MAGIRATQETEKAKAFNFIKQGTKPDMGKMETIQFYNDSSEEYDMFLKILDLRSPLETAKALAELYPPSQKQIKILDVAAGTGLVAVELHKRGFTTMDALDPSEGMLKEAKKKNLYQRFICAYVDGSELDIEDDTYDAVTISAAVGLIVRDMEKGTASIRELIRVVKPGGVFVIGGCSKNFSDRSSAKTEIEAPLDILEKERKWKLERKIPFEYYRNVFDKIETGIVVIYRVC